MKTRKRAIHTLFILILICSPLYAADEKQELSNTLLASAFVRIEADSSFLWIDEPTQLHAVCKPAIQQALLEIAEKHQDEFEDSKIVAGDLSEDIIPDIEFLGHLEGPGNENAVQFIVNIDLEPFKGYPPAAEEIKVVFLTLLKENLRIAYDQYHQSRMNRESAFAEQVAESEQQLRQIQDDLFAISGGKRMEREFLEQQITELHERLAETEFEIQIQENRIQELSAQHAEARGILKDKQANDPITGELEKRIHLLQERLKSLVKMKEAGHIEEEEILELEEHLLSARIELEERKEDAGNGQQAEWIHKLKEEIAVQALELSEQRMMSDFIQKRMNNTHKLLEQSMEHEMLQMKADLFRKTLYESMEDLEELRRQNKLLTGPTVTVISK